jgi:hypothetical protein
MFISLPSYSGYNLTHKKLISSANSLGFYSNAVKSTLEMIFLIISLLPTPVEFSDFNNDSTKYQKGMDCPFS